MRVAYGDSNVLRCSVQFAYDRFFTTFNYNDIQKQVVNTPVGVVNSKDVVTSNTTVDPAAVEGGSTISRKNLSSGGYGGGVGNPTNPRGSGVKDRGNRVPYVNPNPSKNKRGSAFR
jgi:hypothetical protein